MMLRIDTAQQRYRMRDERLEYGESVAHAAGAARQIHDQSAATQAGNTTREKRIRRRGSTVRTNRLRYAGHIALDDGARRLRRHVARGEAGAAGRDHEFGARLIDEP